MAAKRILTWCGRDDRSQQIDAVPWVKEQLQTVRSVLSPVDLKEWFANYLNAVEKEIKRISEANNGETELDAVFRSDFDDRIMDLEWLLITFEHATNNGFVRRSKEWLANPADVSVALKNHSREWRNVENRSSLRFGASRLDILLRTCRLARVFGCRSIRDLDIQQVTELRLRFLAEKTSDIKRQLAAQVANQLHEMAVFAADIHALEFGNQEPGTVPQLRSSRPRWDLAAKTLWFGDKSRKFAAQTGDNVYDILNAFEAATWESLIENPLPDHSRTKDTLGTINKNNIGLTIHSDGNMLRWKSA